MELSNEEMTREIAINLKGDWGKYYGQILKKYEETPPKNMDEVHDFLNEIYKLMVTTQIDEENKNNICMLLISHALRVYNTIGIRNV